MFGVKTNSKSIFQLTTFLQPRKCRVDKLSFSPHGFLNYISLKTSALQSVRSQSQHKWVLNLSSCQVPLNLQARVASHLIETVLQSTTIEPIAQSLLNISALRSSSYRKSWNFEPIFMPDSLTREVGWHTYNIVLGGCVWVVYIKGLI